MPVLVRWTLITLIVGLLTVAPFAGYRCVYLHNKRLREVTEGKVYRSGQMTADGFADAIARYHIRTIVNLQDEYPDPDVRLWCLGSGTVKESELCKRLGVHYVYIAPDLVPRRQLLHGKRPAAVERFLTLMDEPSNYPVLLHCRAGLHRTGVMVAVYRMEYEGWGPGQALRELRDNGFGEWASSAANDYIAQYILSYRRNVRLSEPKVAE